MKWICNIHTDLKEDPELSLDNWPNCFLDLASAALAVVTGFGGKGGIWEIKNLCQPEIIFNNLVQPHSRLSDLTQSGVWLDKIGWHEVQVPVVPRVN